MEIGNSTCQDIHLLGDVQVDSTDDRSRSEPAWLQRGLVRDDDVLIGPRDEQFRLQERTEDLFDDQFDVDAEAVPLDEQQRSSDELPNLMIKRWNFCRVPAKVQTSRSMKN